MDVDSDYFSQRLDKNPSKKLSTKHKLKKSKATNSNGSNSSKRRSSSFFKDFFRVDSAPSTSKVPKESSLKTRVETCAESLPSEDSNQNAEKFESDSSDIYLDDTLIPKKPMKTRSKEVPLNASDIYLNETITSSSVRGEDENVPEATSSEMKTEEDVRWKRLTELKRCPICLKKNEKLVSHIKSCASKNNVSTDQLLKAIDLQLKQNDERSALGFLPSQTLKAPITERSTRRAAASSKVPKDANFELALALSLSLQESKMSNIIDESNKLMEMGLEEEALERRKALEKFTLPQTSNHSSSKPSKSASERRKLQSRLLLRSEEERERIITEKVAIILMENDAQPPPDLDEKKVLQSKILMKYQYKSSKSLWELSKKEVESSDEFYISNLSKAIAPASEDIYSKLKSKVSYQESNSPIKSDSYIEEIFKPLSDGSCNPATTEYRSIDSKTLADNFQVSKQETASKDSCVTNVRSDQPKNLCLLKDLSTNWRFLLFNKTLSDVKIITKEEKEVAAHKIVLFARCPNILDDLITETDPRTNHQSSLLMWTDYDLNSVSLFLEFLYCADVNLDDLSDENVKGELFNLAERYELSAVTRYVQKIESFSKKDCDKGNRKISPIKNFNNQKVSPFVLPSNEQIHVEPYNPHSPNSNHYESRKLSPTKTLEVFASNDSKLNRSVSPDIFSCSDENLPQNISFLDHDPENLKHLVESIKELNEQELGNAPHGYCDVLGGGSLKRKQNTSMKNHSGDSCSSLQILSPKSDGEDLNNAPEFESTYKKTKMKPTTKKSSQENTDSTYYDLNLDSSESQENLNDALEDAITCQNSKRKSSITVEGEHETKKRCPNQEENIVSVDLTLESSNSNSTKVNFCPDNVSETCSLPDLDFDSNQKNLDSDRPLGVDFSRSDAVQSSFNQNDAKSKKVSSPIITGSSSKPESVSPVILESGVEEDDLRDAENGQNCHGYISPFWENFDEGCGIFLAAESPVKSNSVLETGSNSSLTLHDPETISSSQCESSHQVLSPEKITLSSSSSTQNSDKSSQDVVFVSQNNFPTNSSAPAEADENCRVDHASNSTSPPMPFNSPLRPISRCSGVTPEPEEFQINFSTPTRAQKPASKSFADDSLFDNESLLNRIESSQVNANQLEPIVQTPSPCLKSDVSVTPLADYSGMKTAQIKNELHKYGLKTSLGKKKGKVLLRYIYDELHPTAELCNPVESGVSNNRPAQKKRMISSESVASDTDSESDQSNEAKEFECSFSSEVSSLPEEDFPDNLLDCALRRAPKSKFLKGDELEKLTLKFIKDDLTLYKKVLMYEPLWLEKFHEDLKSKDISCKLKDLVDVLDKKCVTFRSVSSQQRNQKRNARKKKAKSSLSQRAKSPRKVRGGSKTYERVTYASD